MNRLRMEADDSPSCGEGDRFRGGGLGDGELWPGP